MGSYQTPTEHGRTHPNPAALIKTIQCKEVEDRRLRYMMLTGLAMRTDLAESQYAYLVGKSKTDTAQFVAALLNNARLRDFPNLHAKARARIGYDTAYVLVSMLDDVHAYLPDLLRAATNKGQLASLPEIITAVVGRKAVHAALDVMVDEQIAALASGQHTGATRLPYDMMASTQTGRLVDAIHSYFAGIKPSRRTKDALMSPYEQILSQLWRTEGISEAHQHLLLDCHEVLLAIEHHLGFGPRPPLHLDVIKRPNSVWVRCLLNPGYGRELGAHTELNKVPYEAVVAAVREGLNPWLLARFTYVRDLPDDVADIMIAHASTNPDEGQDKTYRMGPLPDMLKAVTNGLVPHFDNPRWATVHELWVQRANGDRAAGAAALADYVAAQASWADVSTALVTHTFAAWAARHPDPHLRGEATRWAYLPEHTRAALSDPAPVVRLVGMRMAGVGADDINALMGDPAPEVREAVAVHALTTTENIATLVGDDNEAVRTAAADRVLDALAATST